MKQSVAFASLRSFASLRENRHLQDPFRAETPRPAKTQGTVVVGF